MTSPSLLITHERLARWARQLRPRLAAMPVALVETRSRHDLLRAVSRHPSPLLLVDLEHRPIEMLDDLEAALASTPDARTLVLDPHRLPDVPRLCRELGAIEVMSGPVPPPVVAQRLARWHALAAERLAQDGWTRPNARPPGDLLDTIREGLDVAPTSP